jgi:hypothetical protein
METTQRGTKKKSLKRDSLHENLFPLNANCVRLLSPSEIPKRRGAALPAAVQNRWFRNQPACRSM